MPAGELDDYGRKVWRWIIPLLRGAGIIAKLDRAQLTRYCQLRSRYHKAEEFLRQHGELHVETRKGGHQIAKRWPHSGLSLELHKELCRIEAAFGMDPVSRSRMSVPSEATKGLDMAKAEFFKGGVA